MQLDSHPRGKLRPDLVRAEVECVGWRYEMPGLLRLGGAGENPPGKTLTLSPDARRLRKPDDRPARKVILKAFQPWVEIGQQKFDAREREPAFEVLTDALLLTLLGFALGQGFFHSAACALQPGNGEKAHRQKGKLFDVIKGPL